MTDMQTRDIYINTALDQSPGDNYKTGTDLTNTNELIGVAGHENLHASGERSEAVADRGMTQAQNAWKSENRYNGNTTGGGYRNQEEYANTNSHSLTTAMGTQSAAGVRDAAAKLYMYEDRVLASDGRRDETIHVLSQKGKQELKAHLIQTYVPTDDEQLKRKVQGYSSYINVPLVEEEGGVIKVGEGLAFDGIEYDLNNKIDVIELTKGTGISADIGEDKMIYFANGINTPKSGVIKTVDHLESLENQEVSYLYMDREGAISSKEIDTAGYVDSLKGRKVGYIHNDTEGLIKDAAEYIPSYINKQDIIYAKQLQKIAESGDAKKLLITHSASNGGIYKGARAGALMGMDYGGIDVMSVGSPVSLKKLKPVVEEVGINVIGQYNDVRDPVTWGPVGMSAAMVGAGVVAVVAAPSVLPSLGLYTIPAAGAAGAGAVEAIGIHKYHGIDSYIDRNQNGLRDAINTWSAENPSLQ